MATLNIPEGWSIIFLTPSGTAVGSVELGGHIIKDGELPEVLAEDLVFQIHSAIESEPSDS
jgi:hypothetical protein